MKKNIVLIGFMGTGKTSIGKVLAARLKRRIVDVDRWVEEREKKKISRIFKEEGEDRFRQLEKQAVREIARLDGAVITTGGGAVLDPENIEALRTNGILIALTADPDTVFQRVRRGRHRPLLRGPDLKRSIETLMNERKPFYEQADHVFRTDGLTPPEAARQIEKLLGGLI